MADVKNLDFALGFANAIVNEKWAVQQFPDERPLSNQATHPRKSGQQFNVLDQGTAKMSRSVRVIFSNVGDDFSEIV
jgi:hypothetical protein